jgi:TetR/AcrR family transcriptional repressor of nem operon
MEKSTKRDRTRQSIVEATAQIFNTKGYAGTSINDITEATGLTRGSVYGNFHNKEEVALAVFDYNHGLVKNTIQAQMANAKTSLEKLMAYIQAYDQYSKGKFPAGGCPILNTAIEADDTNPLLKEKSAKAVLKWKKGITDILAEGIESGEFAPHMDVSQFALSLIALIEGGVMISKVTNSQTNLDKILKTAELLINAYIVNPDSK